MFKHPFRSDYRHLPMHHSTSWAQYQELSDAEKDRFFQGPAHTPGKCEDDDPGRRKLGRRRSESDTDGTGDNPSRANRYVDEVTALTSPDITRKRTREREIPTPETPSKLKRSNLNMELLRSYGMRVEARDKMTGDVLAVKCRFCTHFGHSEDSSKTGRSVPVAKGGFTYVLRTIPLIQHHTMHHPTIWAEYQALSDAQEDTFFPDSSNADHTPLGKGLPTSTTGAPGSMEPAQSAAYGTHNDQVDDCQMLSVVPRPPAPDALLTPPANKNFYPSLRQALQDRDALVALSGSDTPAFLWREHFTLRDTASAATTRMTPSCNLSRSASHTFATTARRP